MKTADPQTVVEQLNWRYATKKYDPTRKIPAEMWNALEQSLVMSPSSFGLQPWRFVVVIDPAVRAKIREVAWNQSQVVDASHLVVIASRVGFNDADVERYFDRTVEVTGVDRAKLDGYRNMILGYIKTPPPHVKLDDWTARQTYLALGFFMSAAASMGIDTTPIEGYDPVAVNKILSLPEQGYTATVLATAGYRAPDDKYLLSPKVRYTTQEVVKHV